MSLPDTTTCEPKVTRTAHAVLVPWGLFARRIGLAQALEQVPISQRVRNHTPQSKLVEFLVAHLSGCAYLQDISHGAHPLDQDQVVAEAWGQPAWADYSGVSRTLHACDQQAVDAVREATAQVSRPFIDQEVLLALRKTGVLIYDGDLVERDGSTQQVKRPYSQLTKARKKIVVFWRRLHRRGAEVQRAHRAVVTRQAEKVEATYIELAFLKQRYARFVEENRQSRAPVRAIFRLDGGFGTGENVAWLIKMGYDVYSKAFSNQVTRAL